MPDSGWQFESKKGGGERSFPHSPWGCALIVLWIGAAVCTGRIVWEETVLSWRQGPQMIGFSFLHGIGVWFLLCWAGAHVSMAVLLLRGLRPATMESRRKRRLVLLGLCFVPVTAPLWIPGSACLRFSFAAWGPGMHGGEHLVAAAAEGDLGLVKDLVSRGVPLGGETRYGSRALSGAAVEGRTTVITYLLAEGIDPNESGGSLQRTPLMSASSMNREEAVKLLLRNGANPELRDRNHETALDIAVRNHNSGIVHILQAAKRSP